MKYYAALVLTFSLLGPVAHAQEVTGLRDAIALIEQHIASQHMGDPPPPSDGVRYRADFPDYTVTAGKEDGEGRMPNRLPGNPGNLTTVIRWGYDIENFVWPLVVPGEIGKTRSVIGSMAFHGALDGFPGQEVIKDGGAKVTVVHALNTKGKKVGNRCNLPPGLRFGIEPLMVVHTVDLNRREVFATFSRNGETFRCNAPRPSVTAIRIPAAARLRFHQITNHCDKTNNIQDPTKTCQEREVPGVTYRNGWIELGDE